MTTLSHSTILVKTAVFVVIVLVITHCSAEKSSDQNPDGTINLYTQNGAGGSGSGKSGVQLVAGTTSNVPSIPDPSQIDDSICADQDVQVSRIVPWILFVIDRSSSMNGPYPGSTNRWQAIYDALMAPNEGVIARLHEAVRFGIMLYDGEGTCPRLVTVDPAINNYDPINAVYSTSFPGIHTPTALALNAAYAIVPTQQTILDTEIGQHYVVLCTDGEPNGCPEGTNNDGRGNSIGTDFQGPIDEVTAAAAQDIKTYVVSVASGGQEYQNFLDQLAMIGNTGAPAFSPTTKEDLVTRLTEIVGGVIGCEVELNGKVTVGGECSGTVTLSGNKLECNGPDGWRLVDETHIELLGQACETFKGNPNVILSARFPCGVVVLQ